MSIGMVILTVVAVLIFFGCLERVLDRMHLSDRMALLLVAAMFVGTLLPNVTLGMVQLNIGGAVIPLAVCIYVFTKADTSKERIRTVIGTLLTAGAVYAMSMLLPDEPEEMFMDPNLLYGLAGGAIAWLLGKSRRGAFICGVVGLILADVITALVNWSRGISQPLVLGGAGMADTVVISGMLAVLLAELVGEIVERITRGRKVKKA